MSIVKEILGSKAIQPPPGPEQLLTRIQAERVMPPDEVWAAHEADLDWPLGVGLNSAHEACDRWAADRSRIGMIVCHADGSREVWTFAELAATSRRMSGALAAMGLERGDRVAALVTRQIEAWIGAFAAWRAGLTYVPLFVGFGPDALAERIGSAGAKAVIVDYRYREPLRRAEELFDGDFKVITVCGPGGRGLRPGDASFWAEVEAHPPVFETVATRPEETATLMFTSGTTGKPKGCLMPHWNLASLRPFLTHVYGLTAEDTFFSGADPGWSYGLLCTGAGVAALGQTRVIYTGDFAAKPWLDLLEREQITFMAAAPSAFRMLIKEALRSGITRSLRGSSCAGEPLDAPLVKAWRDLTGHDVRDSYGQTELGMPFANLAYSDRPVIPGALASIVPGYEVGLFDDEGNEVKDQGLLKVKRPPFQGSSSYLGNEELWAGRWDGDWFSTGDVFRRDQDDYWWFVGRGDDLIVTSGYNVGPAEVEAILLDHEQVVDAAAVGADHPDRGKVVRAVIVRSGSGPAEELTKELQEMVRTRLGRHAYPRIVDYVDELPRTETGKVRRADLR